MTRGFELLLLETTCFFFLLSGNAVADSRENQCAHGEGRVPLPGYRTKNQALTRLKSKQVKKIESNKNGISLADCMIMGTPNFK